MRVALDRAETIVSNDLRLTPLHVVIAEAGAGLLSIRVLFELCVSQVVRVCEDDLSSRELAVRIDNHEVCADLHTRADVPLVPISQAHRRLNSFWHI